MYTNFNQKNKSHVYNNKNNKFITKIFVNKYFAKVNIFTFHLMRRNIFFTKIILLFTYLVVKLPKKYK